MRTGRKRGKLGRVVGAGGYDPSVNGSECRKRRGHAALRIIEGSCTEYRREGCRLLWHAPTRNSSQARLWCAGRGGIRDDPKDVDTL